MNREIKCMLNEQNYDVIVHCRSRIVDPLFQHNYSIKRLSEVDDKWAEIIKKELLPKRYFLKFEC